MPLMPGATWRPLAADWASQPRMRAYDIVCIHTMVGGLEGTDNQFRVVNGPGFMGTEAHFGTGADGRIIQWQDTAYQAEANYNGNHHIISIENADWGAPFPAWSGSDVPSLTAAQIEAIAQICAWAHLTHDIPLELIPDSKPGRRGIAPHRWGVPGYVVLGGELWSTANRKACPGDRRIAQIPQIIARARQIVAGGSLQEDDMPYSPAEIHNIVWFGAQGAALIPQEKEGGGAWASTILGSMTARINRDIVAPQVARLEGKIAGLSEAMRQMTSGTGAPIDLKAIELAAERGAQKALSEGVDVDITVGGQDPVA